MKSLSVLPDDRALAVVSAAFAQAAIDVGGTPSTSHSAFEAYDKDGAELSRVNLDTQVSYERQLEGLRLIGPGAKVKVVLDGEGHTTQLVVATHDLVRGEAVPIVPPSQAIELCAEALGGGETLQPTAELVYYAPALAQRAQRIFPHYACGGKKSLDGQDVELRKVLIPAVLDAPKATMTMAVDGPNVRAAAHVRGGTAPYRFSWASSTRSLSQSLAEPDKTEYTVYGRTSGKLPETLTLHVTDANGLTAKVADTVMVVADGAGTKVDAQALSPQQTLIGGTPAGTIGTEWIGTCGGLAGSAGNAGGFVNRFQASGVYPQFNFGEWNAWESDFKDPIYGGHDNLYADAVDLVFYTGHASGDGIYFCSQMDDTWLGWWETRWGNTNLEWMVIAACGPLQDDAGAWKTRWGQAFDGLHLLMGYATVSWDNTTEGYDLADGLLRYDHLTVRNSWALAAANSQPYDVIYAYMGVIGPNWTVPNIDDYFWGMGPVGVKTQGSSIWGFWRIASNS